MTRDCSCRSHCSLYSCRRDGIGPQTCVNDFSLVPKFCCKAGEEAASALPVEYRVMQAAALKVICLTDVAVSTRKEAGQSRSAYMPTICTWPLHRGRSSRSRAKTRTLRRPGPGNHRSATLPGAPLELLGHQAEPESRKQGSHRRGARARTRGPVLQLFAQPSGML